MYQNDKHFELVLAMATAADFESAKQAVLDTAIRQLEQAHLEHTLRRDAVDTTMAAGGSAELTLAGLDVNIKDLEDQIGEIQKLRNATIRRPK